MTTLSGPRTEPADLPAPSAGRDTLPARLWCAVTRNHAATHPSSGDRRLRGRTYAIAFDRVWTHALALCDGGLPRWRVVEEDDQEGVIVAVATTWLLGWEDDVRIEVGLDENGQTRIDVTSRSRKGRGDLGSNARRIGRFLRELDTRLGATPGQILDARRRPAFDA